MPASAESLLIGGLTPLSTLDFPDQLAAVLFCQGCPWDCRYCQNTHLIPPRGQQQIHWHDVHDFLRARIGLLDAAVFSGGEPTAQAALGPAMDSVRDLGFRVGLHTAGSSPRRFEAILPRCDWVGLDIKALPDDYDNLTRTARSGAGAWQCLRLLAGSGIPYEVRTTVHSAISSRIKLKQLAEQLAALGVRTWALQACRTNQGNARELPANQWPGAGDIDFIHRDLGPLFEKVTYRPT